MFTTLYNKCFVLCAFVHMSMPTIVTFFLACVGIGDMFCVLVHKTCYNVITNLPLLGTLALGVWCCHVVISYVDGVGDAT